MPANRLARQKSPYLLQHAHNPVDWYPWSEEAFEKARREDKPIFLSVGYSTCHWCHVMERESFEDAGIAGLLNRSFIPVKLDREERPDIDRIYMLFVQATTGSGGWPMSVWLTPELKPFFGGTYFPPDNRYGRPGFRSVLERIAEAWTKERENLVRSATDVLADLARYAVVAPDSTLLDASLVASGLSAFRRGFDPQNGGFGEAPKFPRPAVLRFLLGAYARLQNREALDMALVTLEKMAQGGIHDHLGGGFYRYSVDARWFVPHFEKMLYDQAQLAVSYLEAFQATGDGFLADVARDILDYVLRDMTSPEGGFYSAEDADSVIDPARPAEKGEGAFHLWTQSEIEAILGAAAPPFAFHYGVEPGGNVREDPQGEFQGKNILFEAHTIEETAATFGQPASQVAASLEASRRTLFAARSRRIRPHLDDKVITAWNGLMISAFAFGAQVLEEPRYLEAARRATVFLLGRMHDARTGVLLRRYRDGEAAVPGFLDDYVFLTQGLLDLYETDFDLRWLETALALTGKARELFEDASDGAFFATAAGDTDVVVRLKDDYDGAEPSGNSVAVINLLRLAGIAGDRDFRASAERTLSAFASRIKAAPAGIPLMLAALSSSLAAPKQIIFAGDKDAADTLALLRVLRRRFLPDKIVLLADSDESRRTLARFSPEIASMTPVAGRAAAYVCESYSCKRPVTDAAELAGLLE